MRLIERQFSDFLRQPNDVVADLAEHDVLLRRRNAPPLRLSQADREEDREEAFDALARLLRNLLSHDPDGLSETAQEVFSWTSFLPEPDRAIFVDELARTLQAASMIDNFAAIGQLLREWMATAEVHADPDRAADLRRPLKARGNSVPAPAS